MLFITQQKLQPRTEIRTREKEVEAKNFIIYDTRGSLADAYL